MAFHDTHHVTAGDVLKNTLSAVGRFFGHIGMSMITAAEGSRRLKTVEHLQAKSDADLEKLGIRREDIVRHVFRDVFFY